MEGWEEFDRRAAPAPTVAFVTLQRRGILALSKAAYALLGNPEAVILLFNREKNLIGLRPAEPDHPRAYAVRVQGSGGTHVISGIAFAQFYGIKTDIARRYRAEKIGEVLTIDLNQDAPDVTGPRGRVQEETSKSSGAG